MTALKSLTLIVLSKIGTNPVMNRRAKIIERLEEQKRLLGDPNYTRTVRTSETKDGKRVPVEKQQCVLRRGGGLFQWNVCLLRSGRLQAHRIR